MAPKADVASIKKLALPEGPKVLPKPKHHNDILPVEERFKQFLKEYMEETKRLQSSLHQMIMPHKE